MSAGSHPRRVQLSSRNPGKIPSPLASLFDAKNLLPPVAVDITKPSTLVHAFEGADVVGKRNIYTYPDKLIIYVQP